MNCEKCGQELPKKKVPKNVNKFLELVANQFKYGGKKYAHSGEKESTDVLFDDFGSGWLLGTVAKYCKRYSNLARERDLLKIACYQFILWLKRGFHLDKKGSYKVINTTVDTKTKYFTAFIDKATDYIATNKNDFTEPVKEIYNVLKELQDGLFILTKEEKYLKIFHLSYLVWDKDIKDKGGDEDVYNETGGKKESEEETLKRR